MPTSKGKDSFITNNNENVTETDFSLGFLRLLPGILKYQSVAVKNNNKSENGPQSSRAERGGARETNTKDEESTDVRYAFMFGM